MTGTLLLAVVFVLYIAAVAACTRRIARHHNQTAARIDRTGREA